MINKHVKICLTFIRKMQIKTSEITLNTHLMAITRDKKTTELEHLHFLISELHHETGEQGGAETGSHTPSMGLQHDETAACMSLKLRSPYGAKFHPWRLRREGQVHVRRKTTREVSTAPFV